MKLSDRAVLTQLNISCWTARKYDKKVSAEIAAQHGANLNAGRYNKRLLQSDLLDSIQKEATSIRNEYYLNTLPWGIEGSRILPTANYLAFMQNYRQRRTVWESMVSRFVQEYDTLKQDAQRLLPNGLYNPADYPVDIANRFGMDLVVLPVPDADFRTELADAELEQVRKDVEARVQRAQETAMSELWGRLHERVQKMAERLSSPDNVFRDSLVDNLRELVDMLPRLNITNDPALTAMAQDVRQKLITDPQGLRDDPAHRHHVYQAAEDIMAKMSGYMGVPS